MMNENKLIIVKWNEDDIQKIGFYDEEGKFHMLFGLAKDWQRKSINVLDLITGTFTYYELEEDIPNEI